MARISQAGRQAGRQARREDADPSGWLPLADAPRRALLVEDNDLVSRSLARVLRMLGVQDVDGVDDVVPAVERLDASPFELVVVDLSLLTGRGTWSCDTRTRASRVRS